jgi:isopenicillin N synthase-like dioxygenase
MRSIAIGLELDEKFFDDKIDQQCHNLRLLSYPPIKRALLDREGQARAGAHSGEKHPVIYESYSHPDRCSDYGTLTLLFQDSVSRPFFECLVKCSRTF